MKTAMVLPHKTNAILSFTPQTKKSSACGHVAIVEKHSPSLVESLVGTKPDWDEPMSVWYDEQLLISGAVAHSFERR